MSIMSLVKKAGGHLDIRDIHSTGLSKGARVLGHAVDKAERYGATYLYGYYQGKNKAAYANLVGGYSADIAIGAPLVLAGAVLEVFTGGKSKLAPHLMAVGDAGVQAYIHTRAVVAGTRAAGRQMAEGPAGGALPPGYTAIGAIPPAAAGTYLTADEIAKWTAPR